MGPLAGDLYFILVLNLFFFKKSITMKIHQSLRRYYVVVTIRFYSILFKRILRSSFSDGNNVFFLF